MIRTHTLWLPITLLCIYLKEMHGYLYQNTYQNIVCNTLNLETTQMPINRWKDVAMLWNITQ